MATPIADWHISMHKKKWRQCLECFSERAFAVQLCRKSEEEAVGFFWRALGFTHLSFCVSVSWTYLVVDFGETFDADACFQVSGFFFVSWGVVPQCIMVNQALCLWERIFLSTTQAQLDEFGKFNLHTKWKNSRNKEGPGWLYSGSRGKCTWRVHSAIPLMIFMTPRSQAIECCDEKPFKCAGSEWSV